MEQKKGRFERMSDLKALIKDAKILLESRSIEIRTSTWDTEEGSDGRFLGIPLGKVLRQHHEQRGYTVGNQYHSLHDSLLSSHPKDIYEKIPGMKELTEKFLKESDELIQKGIEGFQKEFEELDSN